MNSKEKEVKINKLRKEFVKEINNISEKLFNFLLVININIDLDLDYLINLHHYALEILLSKMVINIQL